MTLKRNNIKNLYAIFALLGLLFLFGSFLLFGSSIEITVCTAVMAAIWFSFVALCRLFTCKGFKKNALRSVFFMSAVLLTAYSISYVSFGEGAITINPDFVGTLYSLNVTTSKTGDTTISGSASGYTIEVAGEVANDNCDSKDSPGTVTVTIQNASIVAVEFTLSYTNVTCDEGYTSGTYISIASGNSITFTLSIPEAKSKSGTITIGEDIIPVGSGEEQSTYFDVAPYGSYSVKYTMQDSTQQSSQTITKAITEDQTKIALPNNQAYTLTASPDDGYAFYCWMSSTRGVLSKVASYDYRVYPGADPETIFPLFIKSDSAVYYVQDASPAFYYGFFDEALTAAGDTGTVVVAGSGTLYGSENQKSFTIGTNQKLLVPASASDKGVFGAMPGATYHKTTTPTTYCTLTVPSDVTIICNGAINVNGHRHEQSQGDTGTGVAKGGHGLLVLNGTGDTAQLTINGTFTCYGFAKGTGLVEVNSGANLHELMQLYDWPGGSNISGWGPTSSDTTKLFFATHYYIQNVETPLKVHAGATAFMETALTVGGETIVSSSKLVCDETQTDGLFILGNGTNFLRTYDPTTDRVTYRTFGKGSVKIGSVTVDGAVSIGVTNIPFSLNSAGYTLGFNSALTVIIGDGVTVDVSNRFAIMPGCELIVDSGGTMNVSSELFIIDKDTWKPGSSEDGGMTFGTRTSPAYTASRGTRTTGKSSSSGKLVINGTLNILSSGYVYTTGGADGSSDKIIYGTGVITNAGTYNENEASLRAGYNGTQINFDISDAFILHPGNTALQTLGKDIYHGLGTEWYTHRVDYYEDGVLIPGMTQYTIGDFAADEGTIDCTHIAGLFEGVTEHDPWQAWTDKYQYNDDAKEDPYVHVYQRSCGAQLVVYAGSNISDGNKNKITLQYRLNDYIWLNASCYLNFTADSGFDPALLSVDGDFELVVVGNVVYIVRKVVAKELPDTMEFTLTYDGFQSQTFQVDFTTFKVQTEAEFVDEIASGNPSEERLAAIEEMKALLAAMEEYGEAAKYYFNDDLTWSGTVEAKPDDVDAAIDRTVDANGKSNKSDVPGVSLSTTGANVYFDEALRLGVSYKLSGTIPSGYTVLQIGLLTKEGWDATDGSKAVWLTTTETTFDRAYIMYDNTEKDIVDGSKPNKPNDKYTNASSFQSQFLLSGKIIFDLDADQYESTFTLRPFILVKNSSNKECVIYGDQVKYSLEIYINRTFGKGGEEFDNLLAATWEYAKAANAAFAG